MGAEQIALSLDPWAGYQSRYVAYCRVHWAKTPDAMLARDQEIWPGGCMCGFILWINRQWRKWASLVGHKGGRYSNEDHKAFDAWLTASSSEIPNNSAAGSEGAGHG